MMKCCKCQKHKPLSEFHKNSRKKSGYSNICKLCRKEYQKKWYEKNKLEHKGNTARRKKEKREEWGRVRHTLAIECSDCGENHPACLEFHHISAREISVGQAFVEGRKKFEEELAKCVVLCANCHRKLHYEKQGPVA